MKRDSKSFINDIDSNCDDLFVELSDSLSPLRKYTEEDVIIRLPGTLTVFEIDWFSIFNLETNENYGSIIIPEDLNVPPSLLKIIVINFVLH